MGEDGRIVEFAFDPAGRAGLARDGSRVFLTLTIVNASGVSKTTWKKVFVR